MRDYQTIADQYERDVLSGRVPACQWIHLAITRQQKDVKRRRFPYRYEPARGARICQAMELLPHIKGPLAGQPLTLSPWQVWHLMAAFSWVHRETGLRRFRLVYIEVPRKNGKSSEAAALALVLLTLDGEGGAEVYSAATTRDQAKIVFGVARQMANRCPEFRAHTGASVGAHAIYVEATASKFEPLSADAGTMDGLNTHLAVIDELHAHKTREVYDVLETSTGARAQPLLWCVTTAGNNQAGVCYETRTYLTRILSGTVTDETVFGVIYTTDDGDAWDDEATWRKANPNYGVSVQPDDLARLATKARALPSAQASFLTKRLNVWVHADASWLRPGSWAACQDPDLALESFAGHPAWVGLDLASRVDLASLLLLFRDPEEPDHYAVFGRHYLPESKVEESRGSPYDGWVRAGHLITTPGDIIDLDRIEQDLLAFTHQFQIQSIGYDPFQATQLATHLLAEGAPMVEVRATVQNFSPAMKELEGLVVGRRLRHTGDPVLGWAMHNVVCHRDVKDNIYPRKTTLADKIDPAVALIMALSRALAEADSTSTYDTEDLLVL